jgi:hypothetical protein
METFYNRVETFLTYLPDRTLNAGIDAVTTIIVYDMAAPYAARDYQNALAAWLQGDLINEYKSNPTDENLADIARHAINEHMPHTQSDFDDLVEYSYRFAINETLIENELKKRSNDNGER